MIENVVGAPLVQPVTLCGSMFGLGAVCRDGQYRQLRRHRLFESSFYLGSPAKCNHVGSPVGCYGNGGMDSARNGRRAAWRGNKAERCEAMGGINWMTLPGLSQAIPPKYTEHIGKILLQNSDTSSERGLIFHSLNTRES